MHSYAAFLGNNPVLSSAELAAAFPDLEPKHAFLNQFLAFDSTLEVDQAMQETLGGTILIAKRITDAAVTIDDIPQLLATELAGAKGKVTFGLRACGVPPKLVGELYRHCKDGLKQRGVSSRYVGNEREAAKTVQMHDEGLLDPKKGCEIVILQDKGVLWIGRTVSAQDIKKYTLRDMEKPVRDTTVGLLPPKLAQILLTFGEYLANGNTKSEARNPKGLTVLDPFCGTGVIPMESMLRGWNALASDAALKAVNGCEKNIEWTRKTFKIAKKDVDATVWKQDATKPFELKEKPDVIVTEGTLGPALRSRPTIKDAETYCRDSEELTANFLKNVHATLPGVPVVMILPVWYAQKKMIHLTKIWDRLDKLGFTPVLPPHVNPVVPGHFSLLYRRSDQFVGREIVLLKARK